MDGINLECYCTVCIITLPLNSVDFRNLGFISEMVISVNFLTFSCRAHSRNTFFFGILLGSCVFQSICQATDLTVGSFIIDINLPVENW